MFIGVSFPKNNFFKCTLVWKGCQQKRRQSLSSDEARKQRQKLTDTEPDEMHSCEEYLLCKRKNSRTARP